jgi:hypothetical protein
MRHPVEELGEKRICPETGQPFRQSWTNNLKRPWSFFNECEQCSLGHETVGQTLHRLNEEKKETRVMMGPNTAAYGPMQNFGTVSQLREAVTVCQRLIRTGYGDGYYERQQIRELRRRIKSLREEITRRGGPKPCRCRKPTMHPDCLYCGSRGPATHVCGVCKESGVDGPVIRGTERRICQLHKQGVPS